LLSAGNRDNLGRDLLCGRRIQAYEVVET